MKIETKYLLDTKMKKYLLSGRIEATNKRNIFENTFSACKHCEFQELKGEKIPNSEELFCQYRSKDSNVFEYNVSDFYDIRNFGIFRRHDLCCKSSCKHSLFFDGNLGRPISVLQNSYFGLKTVLGHGDCGFLSILYAILSISNCDDEDKFYENIKSSIFSYINTASEECHEYYNKTQTPPKITKGKRSKANRAKAEKNNDNQQTESERKRFVTKKNFISKRKSTKSHLTLEILREALFWAKIHPTF